MHKIIEKISLFIIVSLCISSCSISLTPIERTSPLIVYNSSSNCVSIQYVDSSVLPDDGKCTFIHYSVDGSSLKGKKDENIYDSPFTVSEKTEITAKLFNYFPYYYESDQESIVIDSYADAVEIPQLTIDEENENNYSLESLENRVFYTLDGTDPRTCDGKRYEYKGNFTTEAEEIKAVGYKNGSFSDIAICKTVKADDNNAPRIKVVDHKEGKYIYLSAEEGLDIYYTLDGTTPDKNYSKRYFGKIYVDTKCTLKAVTCDVNNSYSEIINYEINLPEGVTRIDAPNISVSDYAGGKSIEITAGKDVDIYYTLDGKNPGKYDSKYYRKIPVQEECTVKAVAYYKGKYSDITTFDVKFKYYEDIETPHITAFEKSDSVQITITAGENSDIYYTLDGTTPDKYSLKYNQELYVTRDCVVKAVAYCKGKYSDITSLDVKLKDNSDIVEIPKITAFRNFDSVQIFITAGEDSDIYYTLDGTTPTHSWRYNRELYVTQDCVVKAVAYCKGKYSDIASFDVKFKNNVQGVEMPQITASNYSDYIQIFITAGENSVIYCTWDGSTPDKYSHQYNQEIYNIAQDCVIKAIAYENDKYSKVSSFKVHIPVKAPEITIYDKSGNKTAKIEAEGNAEIYYTLNGSIPDRFSSRYTKPIYIDSTTTLIAVAYINGEYSEAAYHYPYYW